MKWQWSLLPLLLLTAEASAQTPAPKNPTSVDSMLIAAISDSAAPVDANSRLLAGAVTDGGAGGSPSGTRGFSNFIGFFGNPQQNIDPRAVT